MGYPLQFSLRYLSSKKRASISVGTAFAVLGVALGVAALATIMSVTGGFHSQFREKVLGVNAHVLVLKYSTNFREYRAIMLRVAKVEGVEGVAPFSINPMMLTHGDATATGVLVKGVDPHLSLGVVPEHGDEWGDRFPHNHAVLDLPKYIVSGSLEGLRRPDAKPAVSKHGPPPVVPSEVDLPPIPSADDGGAALRKLRRALDRDAPARAASAAPAPPPPASDPPQFRGGERAPGAPSAAVAASADTAANDAPAASSYHYKNALPEDDDLPPELAADPCDDAAGVDRLPGIVVGTSLAKTLDLTLGDCLTVTSPTIGFSFASGQIKPPVAKRFRVIATFEAGFDQYDSKLVYTDLYEAQTFYDHGDTVTGVEMKVDDINQAPAISDAIANELASGMYHTMDWMELNHGLFTALLIQQWAMSGVLALIIIVAAFTVVATLIMVVLDKQKEISVLKAMGATDWAILRIFLYQGGIIGLLGTGLGLALAFLVCKGLLVYGFPLDPKVYFVSRLPVQVRPQEFLITGGVALLICLLATIVPSLYAASLRPADGFRNT